MYYGFTLGQYETDMAHAACVLGPVDGATALAWLQAQDPSTQGSSVLMTAQQVYQHEYLCDDQEAHGELCAVLGITD